MVLEVLMDEREVVSYQEAAFLVAHQLQKGNAYLAEVTMGDDEVTVEVMVH